MAFKMKGSPMKRNFGIGADSPVKQSKQHKKEIKEKQKSDEKYMTDLNKKRYEQYLEKQQYSSDSLNVANQNFETQQMKDYRTMTTAEYKKKYGKNAVTFSPNKMTEDSPFQQSNKDEIKNRKKRTDGTWEPVDKNDTWGPTPAPKEETEAERKERLKKWNDLTDDKDDASPNKQKFVRNIKRKYLEGQHERRTKKHNKRKAKFDKEVAEANEWKELYGTERYNKRGKLKGVSFDSPSDEKYYKKEAKQAKRAEKKANKSLKKLNKTTDNLNKLNKRSKRKGDFNKEINVY